MLYVFIIVFLQYIFQYLFTHFPVFDSCALAGAGTLFVSCLAISTLSRFFSRTCLSAGAFIEVRLCSGITYDTTPATTAARTSRGTLERVKYKSLGGVRMETASTEHNRKIKDKKVLLAAL